MRAKKISSITGVVALLGILIWAFRALRGIPQAAADSINEGETRTDSGN